jgi:3-oxoacyl-[acyl-carrier protein] reductase
MKPPLGQITDEHFRRLFDLNELGLIPTTQEALNHVGPEGGSIINVSSIVSTLSPADQSVYNGTKSAVDGLTRTFAEELGQRKIRVSNKGFGASHLRV